ncbi:hypothetical protein [Acinetobacter wuhouensis]|uniref:hypothetical protein n=1 Tax=Acinetobacter wuhouensis TaxID=1879050 RepID=UPI0013CE8AB1|nr:hypothetical protein [Acinetobacter wuhouensis]
MQYVVNNHPRSRLTHIDIHSLKKHHVDDLTGLSYPLISTAKQNVIRQFHCFT